MSKEIVDEILAIAREIEDQLKFYREIGLEDIGHSAHATELDPTANSESASRSIASPDVPAPSRAVPATPRARYEEKTQQTPRMEEAGLFGEILGTGKPASSRLRGATMPVIESRDPSLHAIREDIGDCRRCKLCEHRTNIVFGEGSSQAKLVFVGEGPGADEDATGRPFVGRAGQLLDKIIEAIGMKREEVYIANIVKCRPPGNRAPERDEVQTCEPFLWRQLAFIRPEVIVALGSPAFQCLVKTKESITRARGQWRDWNGIKLMPTFHPAFLLRSPDKKREVWEDMKKVRDYLNSRTG
jgi:uracil-DNA glycosylase